MNNRQLSYFLKVYECGSIKTAAKELFISSQGLSKMIRQLEEDLNVSLFIRSVNGLTPTPAGIELKPRAEKILNEYELMRKGLNDHYANKQVLTILSTPNLLQYVTVRFLKDYQSSVGNTVLNFVEMSDFAVIEKLKLREVELALIPAPIDTTIFKAEHLFTHRLVAVINKGHPLAQKKVLNLRDLEGQSLARPGRECACYRNQMNMLLELGIKPDIIFETTNFSIIPCFAQQNMAIGITLDYMAFKNPLPDTVIRPFDDPTHVKSTYLAKRIDTELSPAADIFKNFLLKWLQDHKDSLFRWPDGTEAPICPTILQRQDPGNLI